jgi:hypothetical protein
VPREGAQGASGTPRFPGIGSPGAIPGIPWIPGIGYPGQGPLRREVLPSKPGLAGRDGQTVQTGYPGAPGADSWESATQGAPGCLRRGSRVPREPSPELDSGLTFFAKKSEKKCSLSSPESAIFLGLGRVPQGVVGEGPRGPWGGCPRGPRDPPRPCPGPSY